MFSFDNINLVAVSKKRNSDEILKVHQNGINNFGENYLQEALVKIQQLKNHNLIWHFIGSIQSNKTNEIVDNFAFVHSVDRIKIATKLNNRCAQVGKTIKIFLQINIDNEITKSGIKVEELPDIIIKVKGLNNIDLIGLMCIPKPKNAKNSFQKMQKLAKQFGLKELSMGMSNDYQLAIENGATFVRIGTKIFGERA